MKSKLLYGIILSIILVLAGCTKEDTKSSKWVSDGVDATLSLRIPAQADVVSNEDKVTDVRIVSFVPSTATTAPGLLDVNGGKQPLPASGPITQILRTGVRDIHIFANEDRVTGLTNQLNTTRSLTDLATIKLPYSGTLAPPFLCHYVQPSFEIKEAGTPLIDSKVVRTVSKVKLTLTYEWGEGTPLSEELVIDKVQVKHLPKYSYLIGNSYDGVDFADSEILEGTALANQSLLPNEYKSGELIIYIPEFLGATANNYTFVEVSGHMVSNSYITCTYKIPLGGVMQIDGTVTNYNIPRNTQFNINATIKSYGKVDNMAVKIIVLPWNVVGMDEEVGYFLNYNRVTHGDGTPLLDRENINIAGEKITIYCKTNVGGWHASLYKAGGGAKIADSGTTAVVTTGTEQSVSFDIGALGASLNHDEYVVKIFHPVHAPELSGKTIKTLEYVQADGLILNKDLLKGDEEGGNQWPNPPGKYGLQIARKGNVLPKNPALAADIKRPWSATQVKLGVTSLDVGQGKSNTAKLVALGTEYDAANYCYKLDLGHEWYLPSLSETKILKLNQTVFGDKYSFNQYSLYITSSESSSEYVYYLFFDVKYDAGDSNKTIESLFRCVRNL